MLARGDGGLLEQHVLRFPAFWDLLEVGVEGGEKRVTKGGGGALDMGSCSYKRNGNSLLNFIIESLTA